MPEATCVASLSFLGKPPPRPEDSPAAHGEVCVAQGPRGRLPTADADLTGMGGSLAGAGPPDGRGPNTPPSVSGKTAPKPPGHAAREFPTHGSGGG